MARKELSKEALGLVAERFKVLSEPIRLQILHALQEGGKSVNELTGDVRTSQPNVSKHLKILHKSGIIDRRQNGTTAVYSIADESIFDLCELVCGSLAEQHLSRARMFSR